ncbi:MAG: hypothetical protein QOJ65_1507, partial [Fimbriimonadaceae bacterium]|nr:hypothetical protein [Fimbriimonadaceae bacterium]
DDDVEVSAFSSDRALIDVIGESVRLDPNQKELWFLEFGYQAVDDIRTEAPAISPIAIALEEGAQIPVTPATREAMVAPYRELARKWLNSEDTRQSTAGVRAMGALQDRESVPRLLQLLEDRTVTGSGTINQGPREDTHDIQSDAALALASILRKDAVPHIQKVLREAEGYFDTRHLMEALQIAGGAPDEETIERLVVSKVDRTRSELLKTLHAAAAPSAPRIARRLIHDPEFDIRYDALEILRDLGTAEDIPFFLETLNDEKSSGNAALEALERLQPKEFEGLLRKLAADGKSPAHRLAILELAERGDGQALHTLVAWVNNFGSDLGIEGVSRSISVDERVAKILGEKKPLGAKEALAKNLKTRDSWLDTDLHVRGGLVMLGEKKHLPYIRAVAKGEEPTDTTGSDDFRLSKWTRRSSQALIWLGIVKDRESLPLLRAALDDRDREVRRAAKEALKAMDEPVVTTTPSPSPDFEVTTFEIPITPRMTLIATLSGAIVGLCAWMFLRRRERR